MSIELYGSKTEWSLTIDKNNNLKFLSISTTKLSNFLVPLNTFT